MHFGKDNTLMGKTRVVIVAPRHEAWLRIGPGLDPQPVQEEP